MKTNYFNYKPLLTLVLGFVDCSTAELTLSVLPSSIFP